jgi:hypothetical protein
MTKWNVLWKQRGGPWNDNYRRKDTLVEGNSWKGRNQDTKASRHDVFVGVESPLISIICLLINLFNRMAFGITYNDNSATSYCK